MLLPSSLQQEAAIRQIKRHNDGREKPNQLRVNYVFAGHNHGGQVRLPGYVPYLPNKSGRYVNGWYNQGPP